MSMDGQSEKSEERGLADDLLFGAGRIAEFMAAAVIGGEVDADDVYYFRRSGKWPIGKLGKDLIASKAALTRHARKAVADYKDLA
jgi:hypothetical protein